MPGKSQLEPVISLRTLAQLRLPLLQAAFRCVSLPALNVLGSVADHDNVQISLGSSTANGFTSSDYWRSWALKECEEASTGPCGSFCDFGGIGRKLDRQLTSMICSMSMFIYAI